MKKALLSLALSALLSLPVLPVCADDIYLPQLGTAGSLGLSVQREEQLGDLFMRHARGSLPLINDPVMEEYLNSVGQKLILHADNVYFPFEFFLVNDVTLNAAAFLGGKVQVNAGLFIYSQTEDEFASVLAHEITHVTQRHLARYIESQSLKNNVTLASMIGSVVMAIINPAIGMAAANVSMGSALQSSINFTRENEYEADRIGIYLLYRAGFNPEGMVDMFRSLLSLQGNLNPAFVMLIDHPLSEIRVAEAQNRILALPRRDNSRNPDFFMAKARADVRYSRQKASDLLPVLNTTPPVKDPVYIHYAKALTYYELGDTARAREELSALGDNLQNNGFVLDLKTDLDLRDGNAGAAITRLTRALKRTPRSLTIVANLANAYLSSGKYSDAIKVLRDYHRRNEPGLTSLSLLTDAYEKNRQRCEALQTRGDFLALKAAYPGAIGAFNEALQICRDDMTREKIKARVVQISEQRSDDEAIMHGR